MIRKKPAPHLMRGVKRFSEKIMLNQEICGSRPVLVSLMSVIRVNASLHRCFNLPLAASQFRRRLRRISLALSVHRTDSAGFGCRGFVMGNAFPPANPANQASRLPASRLGDDDGFDSDLDHEVILLLQENARLRALVAQLSSLVLKHVVDGK